MSIPYDTFTDAFLSKTTEFDFADLDEYDRNTIVDGYMKRAIAEFKKICKYDFTTAADDDIREFDVEVADEDLDELVDIISDGMLVQWMKPYAYRAENLQNVLNTNDFTTYSPAELLLRVRNAYESARREYIQNMREYSYNHGDLTDLHL